MEYRIIHHQIPGNTENDLTNKKPNPSLRAKFFIINNLILFVKILLRELRIKISELYFIFTFS